VHEAYEVLRDPAKRQQYDARRDQNDGGWGDEYSDDSDDEFEYYHQAAHFHDAWAEFTRGAQAHARAHDRSGGWRFHGHQWDEEHEWREFVEREARERAEWKKSEQKRWNADAELRQARAEDAKTLEMEREEAARDHAIAQEDRLHEKVTKTNKKTTKQAASRRNCTCQGCHDRFVREQNEREQKKKDPKGYAERMAIREAVAARKQKEAAKQACQDEERQKKEQRAAEEAAAKKKIAQEKVAAEQAVRDRIHQQLAEQEARQKAKEQAAAEELASCRRREQLAQREAKEAAERQANETKAAAERKSKAAAELKGSTAAERAAAEEAHRLAELAAREARRREAAKRRAKETAAPQAVEKRLDEAAHRDVKHVAERKNRETAKQYTKEAAERKAKEAAERTVEETAERESKEAVARVAREKAAVRKAKEEAEWEPKESAAQEARAEEERMAQEAEEIDFEVAEERAAVEHEAQERARREAANRKADDLAKGAREISQRLKALRRAEEMARQEARDASKRATERAERGVKVTAEQRTPPANPSIGQHATRALPLQAEEGQCANIPCKHGQRCKFLAAGICAFLHQDQLPAIAASVKSYENIARSPQAEGDRRSKTRCRFGKNCKYLPKGICVYRHTEDELANASSVAQSVHQIPSRDSTKSETIPSEPGWRVTLSKAAEETETANQDIIDPDNRVPTQPADQIVQKYASFSQPVTPGFLRNLPQAARVKISNNYIQTTKDGIILKLLEEGKHVPADGIAVDLGWTIAGPAFVCFFCKFKGLKYSFCCPQGNAVACGRCKKALSTVTPEDEAILISAE
jgi:hypothetical protein